MSGVQSTSQTPPVQRGRPTLLQGVNVEFLFRGQKLGHNSSVNEYQRMKAYLRNRQILPSNYSIIKSGSGLSEFGNENISRKDLNQRQDTINQITNEVRQFFLTDQIQKLRFSKPGGSVINGTSTYRYTNAEGRLINYPIEEALIRVSSFQMNFRKNASKRDLYAEVLKRILLEQPFSRMNEDYDYVIWGIKIILSEPLEIQPRVTVPMRFSNPTFIAMYNEDGSDVLDQNVSEHNCCVIDFIQKEYVQKYKYIPKVRKSDFPNLSHDELVNKMKECYLDFAKEAQTYRHYKPTNQGSDYTRRDYIEEQQFYKDRRLFWSVIKTSSALFESTIESVYTDLDVSSTWNPETDGVSCIQLLAFFKHFRVTLRVMDQSKGLFMSYDPDNKRHVQTAVVLMANGHAYIVADESIRTSLSNSVNRSKKRIEVDQSRVKKIKQKQFNKPISFWNSKCDLTYAKLSKHRNEMVYAKTAKY